MDAKAVSAPPNGVNLEASGQNARLRLGAVMLGVSLVAAIFVVQSGVHWVWRLPLFMPFFIAAAGAWQGLYRTCPGLAMKGVKEGRCGGEARVARPEDLCAARRAGRTVLFGSLATAAFSTGLVVLIP